VDLNSFASGFFILCEPIIMEWLIVTQIITLIFLIMSELLGVAPTEVNGIIDSLLKIALKAKKSDIV
jgi:hypothetical protein